MLTPTSIQELQDMVTSHDRVLAVGGRTKTRLSAVDDCQIISTRALSGITEYEPSEYTFTALAGTPVSEIHNAVQAKGQFLPCSALLRESGSTLGGAIASGLSGPGRFRFGGLRDFILGIQFVAGDGKLISSGGKVVKNAAGFDLPKFMVGSLGRYGILTEVTFKVFPEPSSLTTVSVVCASHEEAMHRICRAASSRWELYAIDYDASERSLYLRIGGPAESVKSLTREVLAEWHGDAMILSEHDGHAYWECVRRLSKMPTCGGGGGCAAKVPLTPKLIPPLQQTLDRLAGIHVHYSVAGNVAVITTPDASTMIEVGQILSQLNLKGMTFIGGHDVPLWLGEKSSTAIEPAIKNALDPQGRFPLITDH